MPPPPSPSPPLPPWRSASATATRFATHWIADALAGDDSFDFSVLQALLRASSEPLAGAPEATRERIALRSLQEVSSLIPAAAGGHAAATPGVLRVDGARSGEDVLFRLIREVEIAGKLENDLLSPFSQDIQESICTKKLTLPETSFQLLKGIDPWITSMTQQSELEHSSTEQFDHDQSMRSSHKCVNVEKPVFSTEIAEDIYVPTSVLQQPSTTESRSHIPPQEDNIHAFGLGARSPERSPIVEGSIPVGSVFASAGCDAPLQGSITEPFSQQDKLGRSATVEPKSCRQKSPNLPHCAHGEGADDGGASNQSSKVSIHEGPSVHATVTPGFDRISDVLPTDASEPRHLPECITAQDTTMVSKPDSRKALQHERGEKVNQDLEDVFATEDRMAFEEQNADKSRLEVSGANKVDRDIHNDGSIMKNNMAHGGLIAQTAPVSQNCNVTLHDKTSEAEQKNQMKRTDVQKDKCCTSIPISSKDIDGGRSKKTSNDEKSEDTSLEISVCSKDQDSDDTLEGLSQQDLCIKCGKDGLLLKCCDCSLAAHASCFGPVTFEGTDLFYCPVCISKKAWEGYVKARTSYCEATKNLAAFLGTAQVSKLHDEQLNGVQPGAANRDGHFKGCGTSKRKIIHQTEAFDLAHQDEEPHQPRMKQKVNARGNGYPKEVLNEKVPFQNSGPSSMNKHSVLQNNGKTRVEDPEKKQQAGDKEACKEAGNDNSAHKRRPSSRRRCDPPSNQDGEADQEDSLTASNQTGGSDELEATSSNDCVKRSSPPCRSMRHSKKRLHEKESAVPRKSRKDIAKQNQHVPTSPRNRSSEHPQKRYSNPVAPTGRRSRTAWTEEEESMLREAMAKFAPQDDAEIPWTRILKYGRNVFHRMRLAPDLRVKWRNMKKKTDGGNVV